MSVTTRAVRLLAPLFSVLLLAACGGGSSGDGDSVAGAPGAGQSVGSVALEWQGPATRVDGSCLYNQLAGFVVHYGTGPGNYTREKELLLDRGDLACEQTGFHDACGTNICTFRHTFEDLPRGEWYFTVQAIDDAGLRSAFSDEVQADVAL